MKTFFRPYICNFVFRKIESFQKSQPLSQGGNFCIRRGRGEKVVSDNSKCTRTFKEGRVVNLISSVGRYRCFLEWSIVNYLQYIVEENKLTYAWVMWVAPPLQTTFDLNDGIIIIWNYNYCIYFRECSSIHRIWRHMHSTTNMKIYNSYIIHFFYTVLNSSRTRTLFFVLEFLDILPNEKCIITRGKPEVPWTVPVDGKIWWKTLAIMSPDTENRRGNPTHLRNRINYNIPYLPMHTYQNPEK
jgi:hypothetical protein